jgi:copper chaperone CopZ
MLVHGMSCPLCAKNVDIELRRIKGVSMVEADLGEGFVYVTLDGSAPVTRGQLARAVNDSGFTIKSFQN